MAKGPRKKCVKVPIEDIRARLGAIDEVKDLPDAILDGLAKAICLTRPHPPQLGRLITAAKSALKGLARWIEDNGDDPAFRKYLSQVANELEARRRKVMVAMKMERPALSGATVYFDKDGTLQRSKLSKLSEAEPERFFLGVGPSLAGEHKHLDAMLVLGMGVLMEFLDEEMGFKWRDESEKEEKIALAASELMAKVLDEFWKDDKRIGKIADGHMRTSINSQHKRAVKKLPSLPTRGFLKVLKDLRVTHAWLPVPPAQPDDC